MYDTEKLFGRLLIISQKRQIDLEDVFGYELAPVPSALFDDYGDMRKGTKSVLVQKLAVFVNQPDSVQVELMDGNEALYHTFWPKSTTIQQFADSFCRSYSHRQHHTYVIFDKYDKNSI